MLSNKNIEKLCMSGLYKHDPVKEWRGSAYKDNLYWCFNWTFTPSYDKDNNIWYMVDTYYGDTHIKLTDENFDGFEFVFDFNEVVKVSNDYHFSDYNENDFWFKMATDSGGWEFAKSYIKKDAKKNKNKVIQRLTEEIEGLERSLEYKKEQLERIKNDEIDLKYIY